MTVLPVSAPVRIPPTAGPLQAIPAQRRPTGAHRARGAAAARPVPAHAGSRRQTHPALHGAGAAALTIVARAGSLTTLAAALVLGGALVAATDGTAPEGPAAGTTAGLQAP